MPKTIGVAPKATAVSKPKQAPVIVKGKVTTNASQKNRVVTTVRHAAASTAEASQMRRGSALKMVTAMSKRLHVLVGIKDDVRQLMQRPEGITPQADPTNTEVQDAARWTSSITQFQFSRDGAKLIGFDMHHAFPGLRSGPYLDPTEIEAVKVFALRFGALDPMVVATDNEEDNHLPPPT